MTSLTVYQTIELGFSHVLCPTCKKVTCLTRALIFQCCGKMGVLSPFLSDRKDLGRWNHYSLISKDFNDDVNGYPSVPVTEEFIYLIDDEEMYTNFDHNKIKIYEIDLMKTVSLTYEDPRNVCYRGLDGIKEMIFPFHDYMEKKRVINSEILNTEFIIVNGGSGGGFSLTTDPKIVKEYLEIKMPFIPNTELFKEIMIDIDNPYAFNCVAPNGQQLVVFYGY